MTIVGSSYGVGFEFDEHGQWCGVVVGRHHTHIAVREALGVPTGPLDDPLPIFPTPDDKLWEQVEQQGLDAGAGYEAGQSVGAGQRQVQVMQSRWQLGGGLGDVDLILGRARLTMQLDQPATWRVTLPPAARLEARPDQVVAFHSQGVVRLRTDQPLAVEGADTVRVQLPAGESQVEVWVENRPAYPVAPVVILGTPAQMREAAVVATCVPGDPAPRPYIPVLDVPLPPASAAEFEAGNEKLMQLAQELQQVERSIQQQAASPTGGVEQGGIVLPTGGTTNRQQQLKDLTERRQTLMEELQPLQRQVLGFAVWSQRWQRLLRIMAAVAPPLDPAAQHILLLYPYAPDLVASLPPQAQKLLLVWEGVENVPDYPAEAGVQVIRYRNLDDLADQTWAILVGGKPAGRFNIPDDPRFYPLGVVRALDVGKPLSPRGRGGSDNQLEAATSQVNHDREGAPEIVLVECDGSLGTLAAALYAYHADLPVYTYEANNPEPFLGQVGLVQENIEKQVMAQSAGEAFRYVSEHKQAFVQDQQVDPQLRQLAGSLATLELPRAMGTPYAPAVYVQMLLQYESARQAGLGTDFRYTPEDWQRDLETLERIATGHVSAMARKKAQRAQRITAYTLGVAYTFVAGWQDKAIGHLSLEAPLLVLRHVLSQAIADAPLTLATVLDAGFLDPLPTTAFADRLNGPASAVFTLREAQATTQAWQVYGRFMPTELTLLHTQGTPNSLILWAAPTQPREVPDLELELNLDLSWGPLVFNHGYLSWLGLGPGLVRAGARAFIAPLWSPDSDPARDMAIQTFVGAQEGQPFAQALAAAQVEDASTRRAYACLGPASAALHPAPADASAGLDLIYAPLLELLDMGLLPEAQDLYERYVELADRLLDREPAHTIQLALRRAYYLLRRALRDDAILARQAREHCREARDRLPSVPDAALRQRLQARIAALQAAAETLAEHGRSAVGGRTRKE